MSVLSAIEADVTEEGMLRPREVARMLSLNVNTVKRIPPTELPFYRIGTRGDRRYRPEDIEQYLREKRAR